MKQQKTMKAALVFCTSLLGACSVLPQHAGQDHSAHAGHSMSARMSGPMPTEIGQSAFAAIAEIVAMLDADPNTDWSRVDIEALRQHLIDMELVTTQAKVKSADTANGQLHTVSGDTVAVVGAIQRMVVAHSAMMNGKLGWALAATKTDTGVTLDVSSDDAGQYAKIKGLGFAGFMALGMHHQAHHWMIATGHSPH